MDLTGMTDAELSVLAGEIRDALDQREAAYQSKVQTASTSVTQAIATLTALIGPEAPTAPGLTSITEMRLYSNTVLQQNAGQALNLILRGMETLARTTRDIAMLRANKFG